MFYIFDVPHLLKSTRNNFYSSEFRTCDGFTSKIYLGQFYKADKQKPIRLTTKLTDHHIYPNTFEKMRVEYVAQVFSNTVVAAMSTYISFGALPASVSATVTFCEKLNCLFDLLNSTKFESSKRFGKPFTASEDEVTFLKGMLDLFSNLKVYKQSRDISKTIKFCKG